MKNLTLLAIVCFICACKEEKKVERDPSLLPLTTINNPLTANDSADFSNHGVLTFTDTLHHFGKIKEGEKVTYSFNYTNTGKSPVVISQALASCGCTASDYKKDPIVAGEKGEIKVTFNSAGKFGYQKKVVTLMTNAHPSEMDLIIDAEIN